MKIRTWLSRLICTALLIVSSLQASAYWLEPVGNEKSLFGKDLRVGGKGNDSSRIVEIIFSDQFDFSDYNGLNIVIEDDDGKGISFSGMMMLHELGPEFKLAPNGRAAGFEMNSHAMEKCKIQFEPKYKGKTVSVWLSFVMKDGKPIGYKLEVEEQPEEEKKPAE